MVDDGDGVFQTGEWVDDGDGVFQTGKWVDNGDGVYGIGDRINNTIVTVHNLDDFITSNGHPMYDTGEWDWDGSQGSGTTSIDLNFDSGEWYWDNNRGGNGDFEFDSGDWYWDNNRGGNGDFEFDSGDWTPTSLPGHLFKVVYTEWYDYDNGTCSNTLDSDEIDYTLKVDPSLYNYNSNDWDNVLNENPNAQRLGANIWNINSNIYLVGGHNAIIDSNPSTTREILEFKNNDWSQVTSNPNFNTRNFAFSFVIGDKGYIGGGENNTGNIVPADLWEFDTKKEAFKTRTCGIEAITRSVSFALGGRGFVGFGKTGENREKFHKGFWMYVPCRRSCD